MPSPAMTLWILGAGRVACALAVGLSNKPGLGVHVWSRRSHHPLTECLPQTVSAWTGTLPSSVALADIVVLCVSDDALATVAGKLARVLSEQTDGAPQPVVLHTSGLLSSGALTDAGVTAAVGSLHPALPVPPRTRDPSFFEGAIFAVEGDARACQVAQDLTSALGASQVAIHTAYKAHYHMGAVMASNYVVALADAAMSLFHRSGIAPGQAHALVASLLSGSRAALERGTPAEVLTGPIVRADEGTIRAHLAACRDNPPLDQMYRALGHLTVALAEESHITAQQAERLHRILSEAPPPQKQT